MDSNSHPYVIDADAEGSTRETAILLVGTATEAGLDPSVDIQRITRPSPGFRITEALAEALGGSLDEEPAPTPDEAESITLTGDGTGVAAPAPETDLSGNKQSLAPEHDIHGAPTSVAYQDWAYGDLKSAVSTRGIEVENQKTETLIAALVADDAENADLDAAAAEPTA